MPSTRQSAIFCLDSRPKPSKIYQVYCNTCVVTESENDGWNVVCTWRRVEINDDQSFSTAP